MSIINSVGRPKVDAPPGYVALADAARRASVSYSTAYRLARGGLLRSRKMPSGAIIVDERDIAKIGKHVPPADRARVAVQVRPRAQRHVAWAAAAASAGKGSVTAWLCSLADAASGYSPGGEEQRS